MSPAVGFSNQLPVVLSFNATDPTGGSAMPADIETLAAVGCHAVPINTGVLAQDTTHVIKLMPVPAEMVRMQAKGILEDIPVNLFKVGLIGSIENVHAVARVLQKYPQVPVVFHAAVCLGGRGYALDDVLIDAIREIILPMTTLIITNPHDLPLLAPQGDGIDAHAQSIMAAGCAHVLVQNANPHPKESLHVLYSRHQLSEQFIIKRPEQPFLGVGCTLSAAISGFLAQGMPLATAIRQGEAYLAHSLQHGYRIGMGKHIPSRIGWMTEGNAKAGGSGLI